MVLYKRILNNHRIFSSCYLLKYLNGRNYRNISKFSESQSVIDIVEEYDFQSYANNFTESSSTNEMNCSSNYFRNLLYPTSEDEIINKLKACNSCKQIFEVIDKPELCTPHQLTQAVLVLRDFQISVEASRQNSLSSFNQLQEDINAVLRSSFYSNLVNSVTTLSSQMTLEELSCCLFYLFKLNIDQEQLMKLITSFENSYKNAGKDAVSLSSLIRFCIPVMHFRNIWSFYTLLELSPVLLCKLDYCDNYSEFGKITACFQKMMPLLNSATIDKFIEKCSILFKKSEDTDSELERLKTIIKVVVLLNHELLNHRYRNLMKQLLISIYGNLKNLTVVEIFTLRQIVFRIQEPYQIQDEFNKIALRLTDNIEKIHGNMKLLVVCMFLDRKDLKNDEMETLFKNYSEQPVNIHEIYMKLDHFYNMLLTLKIKTDYSDIYWTKILQLNIQYPLLKSFENLMWICRRYMRYSLYQQYYHEQFESLMLSYLYHFFNDNGKALHKPSDFVICTLVILSFEKSFSSLTNSVLERIMRCIPNLDIQENSVISFMLNFLKYRSKRLKEFEKFLPFYVQFNLALNGNSLELLLKKKDIVLHHLNLILRSYNYREGIGNTAALEVFCDRLVKIPEDQMNYASIRDIITQFFQCCHLEPLFVDNVVKYFIKERDFLHTSHFSFILHYMFSFGYTPSNSEMFTEIITKCFNRDRESLSQFIMIRIALELCYFNELPSQLIHLIFDIKFLEKLDEEIQRSSNKSVIRAVREELMELNRIICIDYPNQEIPWFHEKYCMEKRTLESCSRNFLRENVLHAVKELVKVEKSIQVNCCSPYHHKIDILLYTNRKGEPVDPDTCQLADLRKTAILLKNKKSSSLYYFGKGTQDLKIRHLEMLGYKVVVIDKRHWNSMYMSEPQAKENFLFSHLWSH